MSVISERVGTLLDDDWGAESDKLGERFDSPEMEKQLKLEKKLDKILKPLATKKPKSATSKKLRKFAEDAGESPLAGRANTLADAIDYAVEEL